MTNTEIDTAIERDKALVAIDVDDIMLELLDEIDLRETDIYLDTPIYDKKRI